MNSRPSVGRARSTAAGVALSLLMVETGTAQEILVPVALQVELLLKILPFDRNLTSRTGPELLIGVVYQSRNRASLNVMNELISEIEKVKPNVNGIKIACIPLDIGNGDHLEAISSAKNIDALYVTPVRAIDMARISALSRSRRLMTITGVPRFVENGLAVGFGAKGGRPLVLINLPSAVAEGADFSSQLLKLAKVIR